jgi:hypothetical protein
MAVEARYFLGGQAQSARFADFVPRKMKYVAIIAAGNRNQRLLKRLTAKIGRRHDKAVLSGEDGKGNRDMFNDKLSRSK